jgi:hypothetical protein
MKALAAFSAATLGVVLFLAVAGSSAGAQAAPTIATDAPQYLPSTTVTYTGTGYTGCASIQVDVFGPGGHTVATGITPSATGSFTGTFTAGTVLTTYMLVAASNPIQAGCTANVNFDVVNPLPTTTTTTSTTTTSTSTTSTTSTTAVPHTTTTIGGTSGSSTPVAAAGESTAKPSDTSTTGSELANTGNNTGPLVRLGVGLLCAGFGVLALRRTRAERRD